MTRLFIASAVAVFASLSFFSARADEKERTVSDLVRFLEREYHLSTTRIAEYLTLSGFNVKTHESKLVRWSEGTLSIAVLTKDVESPLIDGFKASMDRTAAAATRDTHYCTEDITRADFGARRPHCLDENVNVIVFIDGSPETSTEILQSFATEAPDAAARVFWKKYADQAVADRSNTYCEGGFSIDPKIDEITSGRAYFRVIPESDENLRWVNTCTAVLPFLVFGQMPIRKSGTEQTFITELLELNYSKELLPGMTMDEVLKVLNEKPL